MCGTQSFFSENHKTEKKWSPLIRSSWQQQVIKFESCQSGLVPSKFIIRASGFPDSWSNLISSRRRTWASSAAAAANLRKPNHPSWDDCSEIFFVWFDETEKGPNFAEMTDFGRSLARWLSAKPTNLPHLNFTPLDLSPPPPPYKTIMEIRGRGGTYRSKLAHRWL